MRGFMFIFAFDLITTFKFCIVKNIALNSQLIATKFLAIRNIILVIDFYIAVLESANIEKVAIQYIGKTYPINGNHIGCDPTGPCTQNHQLNVMFSF